MQSPRNPTSTSSHPCLLRPFPPRRLSCERLHLPSQSPFSISLPSLSLRPVPTGHYPFCPTCHTSRPLLPSYPGTYPSSPQLLGLRLTTLLDLPSLSSSLPLHSTPTAVPRPPARPPSTRPPPPLARASFDTSRPPGCLARLSHPASTSPTSLPSFPARQPHPSRPDSSSPPPSAARSTRPRFVFQPPGSTRPGHLPALVSCNPSCSATYPARNFHLYLTSSSPLLFVPLFNKPLPLCRHSPP